MTIPTTPASAAARFPLLLVVHLMAVGCGPPDEVDEAPAASAAVAAGTPAEQEAFWAALSAHCGMAYGGKVSDATPHYRASAEREVAVIHFMSCSEDRIHIPLHLDDDRSRNWILTKVGGTIRLKHDHRHEDGTEDTITQYGGDAPVPGLATRQIFRADAHTAEILPLRWDNFWFFDFVNDTTLQYGVHWPTMGHSIRYEFDLSTPVPAPPPPWGYEPR
ncbi:MAG TPA: hypothetical protein VMK53_08320 [Gemmatimonadales bacterium]|nr:hypothetical protein [Gemmatimonadales bacterium]